MSSLRPNITHICVSILTTIGSDKGLLPARYQAIIWTNTGILLIGLIGTTFSDILIQIHTFSFEKMPWKWRLENCGNFVSASICLLHSIKHYECNYLPIPYLQIISFSSKVPDCLANFLPHLHNQLNEHKDRFIHIKAISQVICSYWILLLAFHNYV